MAFHVAAADEISDFLKNKVPLKPQQYEGDLDDGWNVAIKRNSRPFKLKGSTDEEEMGELSFGLPVSQDLVFSRRRSVVNNALLRQLLDFLVKCSPKIYNLDLDC